MKTVVTIALVKLAITYWLAGTPASKQVLQSYILDLGWAPEQQTSLH